MGKLFDRILDAINKIRPSPGFEDDKTLVPGDTKENIQQAVKRSAYLSEASMVHLARNAAQQRLLIYLSYNGQWRYCECYSIKAGKSGTFLYAYCLIHQRIHSFYIHRIQEMQPTTIPFNPRWIIEM